MLSYRVYSKECRFLSNRFLELDNKGLNEYGTSYTRDYFHFVVFD